MKAILKVVEGPDIGACHQLEPGAVCRIGRSAATSDMVLGHDPYVSASHCVIEFRDGSYWLTHAGSANPSFVNDNVVTRRRLRHGDIIRVGFTRIECRLEGNGDEHDAMSRREAQAQLSGYTMPVCCYCGNTLFSAGSVEEWEPFGVYCCQACLPAGEPAIDLNLPGYTVLARVGSGAWTVFLAAVPVERPPCYRLYAIKRPACGMTFAPERLAEVIRVLTDVREPHLARFHTWMDALSVPHIVMDPAPAGTLDEMVLSRARPFLPERAIGVLVHVLKGLGRLHHHATPVSHGCITHGNILVRLPGQPECAVSPVEDEAFHPVFQVADFLGNGILIPSAEIDYRTWLTGIPAFAAPESLSSAPSPVGDLYSAGAVVYYLLTGRFARNLPSPLEVMRFRSAAAGQGLTCEQAWIALFEDRGCHEALERLLRLPAQRLNAARDSVPEALCDIVNRLTEHDYRERFQDTEEALEALTRSGLIPRQV